MEEKRQKVRSLAPNHSAFPTKRSCCLGLSLVLPDFKSEPGGRGLFKDGCILATALFCDKKKAGVPASAASAPNASAPSRGRLPPQPILKPPFEPGTTPRLKSWGPDGQQQRATLPGVLFSGPPATDSTVAFTRVGSRSSDCEVRVGFDSDETIVDKPHPFPSRLASHLPLRAFPARSLWVTWQAPHSARLNPTAVHVPSDSLWFCDDSKGKP